jgi:hypothetical protein
VSSQKRQNCKSNFPKKNGVIAGYSGRGVFLSPIYRLVIIHQYCLELIVLLKSKTSLLLLPRTIHFFRYAADEGCALEKCILLFDNAVFWSYHFCRSGNVRDGVGGQGYTSGLLKCPSNTTRSLALSSALHSHMSLCPLLSPPVSSFSLL